MSCTLPTASIGDGAAGVRWQPAHKKTQAPRIRTRLPGISVPGKACRYDATRGTSNPRLDADVTDTPVRRCGASYDISERAERMSRAEPACPRPCHRDRGGCFARACRDDDARGRGDARCAADRAA